MKKLTVRSFFQNAHRGNGRRIGKGGDGNDTAENMVDRYKREHTVLALDENGQVVGENIDIGYTYN